MKKLYTLPAVAILAAGIFAFQTAESSGKMESFKQSAHLQNNGGQASLTGAPGESDCTFCHTGSVLDGSSENQFALVDAGFNPVGAYIPGASYTATLQLGSNPDKKGFSSTTLENGGNSMAGSLTGMIIGGTQDFQNGAGTKDYVSHKNSSNTNAFTLWSWTWDAPASDVGPVTFYIASNVANDNDLKTGDEIYLSQHIINSSAGIEEVKNDVSTFTAGYNVEGNSVVINFMSMVADQMYFNLIDLNGKSVYSSDLAKSLIGNNKQTISLPSEIENGIYVVNFFVGNRAMSSNVMVQQ
ncbi:MAG: hypothetical protein HRT57_00475 [Crocinitomicaceae bacterium]|nr:hypothetical protein [Crocinitomicaceae bacterium]